MLLKESWVAGSFFGCELYCSVEYRVYTLHFTVLVVRLLQTPTRALTHMPVHVWCMHYVQPYSPRSRSPQAGQVHRTVGLSEIWNDCRTVGTVGKLSETVGLSEWSASVGTQESLADTVGMLSDTVGLSDCRNCRTVGHCRTLSDSYCRTVGPGLRN